ncbi:MAG TPA: TonB-dependent siderophore receptor [Pyrinomonadaceae bacterium]
MARKRKHQAIFFIAAFISGTLLLTPTLLCQAQTVKSLVMLRGRVLDQNRAAISGAKVSAEVKGLANSLSTFTDENGEFSLSLAHGECMLTIIAEGFAQASQTVQLNQTEGGPLEFVLQVARSTNDVTILAASGYEMDVTGSATKTLTALRDIPQSITVVTSEQIKDQLMQSVGDVARYTPGLSVHQGENNRDQIIFRGQSSSADFFLNGARDDVQYYRDLYNLERLEVLKGPNAMIFGRGGGGGVINRVTKEANFSPSAEISLLGGSFYNRRIAADFNHPFNDRVALRLNGVYENSDSFRKFVNLHRAAINPTFTIIPSDHTRITFGYEYAHDRRVADRGITSFQGRPADVPINTYYGDASNSQVRSDVHLLTGTINHQIRRLNINNRTLFGDYDRFYQNYVPGATDAAKTQVILSAYNNATRRKNFFNQTDLTSYASTGRVRHTLLGGVELGRQLTDNFRNTGFFNNTATTIRVPYNNPITSTPVTFRQSATDANNHLETNLAATYVQDQIELSRFIQIIAGLRYDYFDLRFHNNRNGDALRRIDNLLSPRAGVVIKPVGELSLYGSYSVSYLPSSGDQFSSLTTVTQQVKPEKFTNYEVGVKWDLHRNLSLTSALYHLDRTNTRATDPNNPTAIIQTGSQRTNGFELGLQGSVTHLWSIAGGYSYQDAFITNSTTTAVAGKQVSQVPHHMLSVWNRYQFLPKLGVGLGIISRTRVFAALDNTVTLPGYTRADAALYYNFTERWRLQGNIENLFNLKYFINADSNTNISPGGARALRVGLTARF